jgi:hypothetical protein
MPWRRSQSSEASDAGVEATRTIADAEPRSPKPGESKELPELTKPDPILFPSFKLPVPPDKQPDLASECPNNGFFGDPPTRSGQITKGSILTPSEQANLKTLIEKGIAESRTKGLTLAPDNFQHWIEGKFPIKVIPATYFLDVVSQVPSFLAKKARAKFEQGIIQRLKDPNHPAGTLRPPTLVKGAKGSIRFLQFEDGVKPDKTEIVPLVAKLSSGMNLNPDELKAIDIFFGLGSFNVHSVIWVQATWIGQSDGFNVEILKWCVQIYDVYDWNADGLDFILIPISAQLRLDIEKTIPVLPNGVSLGIPIIGNKNVIVIKDDAMRNLEVSGVGRAYLVRSETFEAPLSVRSSFKKIKV